MELQPSCPLALWHYAGALALSEQPQPALAIWTILLEMDLETIAEGECGEGMDRALQLVNDVHFRMARVYQAQGRDEPAQASFKKYLHNRHHGVGSLYDADIASKFVGKLG